MLAVGAVPAAVYASSPDPEAERDKVRSKQSATEAMLADLTANADAAETRLATASQAARKAEQKREAALAAVSDAKRQAETAKTQIAKLQMLGIPLKQRVKQIAVDQFIGSAITSELELFDGTAPETASRRNTIRKLVSGDTETTMEELRAHGQDLTALQAQYSEAQHRSEAEAANAQAEVERLNAAKAKEEAAIADLEQEVEQLAIHADELRAIDAKLTAQIDARNAAFAAKVRAEAARKEKERLAAAAAAERAAAEKQAADNNADSGRSDSAPPEQLSEADSEAGSSNSNDQSPPSETSVTNGPTRTTSNLSTPPTTEAGTDTPTSGSEDSPTTSRPTTTTSNTDNSPTTTRPTTTTKPPTTTPEPTGNYDSPYYVPGYPPPPDDWSPPPGLPTWDDIVYVNGIAVHKSIASQLRAMTDAAAKDGIVLGGGGFRDLSGQLKVRKNNCGSSAAAIWLWPASQCSPPTARPGTSQHQKGLAIDFSYQGTTICFPRPSANCTNNKAFTWLKNNASRFGFYNLSSEAWHWSTTGR